METHNHVRLFSGTAAIMARKRAWWRRMKVWRWLIRGWGEEVGVKSGGFLWMTHPVWGEGIQPGGNWCLDQLFCSAHSVRPPQPTGNTFLPFMNVPTACGCLVLSVICSYTNIIRGLLAVRCMCGIQSHVNLWQIWACRVQRGGAALDSGNAMQCGTSWGTDHYIYRDGRLDLHCTLSISHFSVAPLLNTT